MARNSTQSVTCKEHQAICADLEAIYTALSEKAGREALEYFGTKWNER